MKNRSSLCLSDHSNPQFFLLMFFSDFTAGAFVGCSLEGNVVATRSSVNTRFYGDPCLTSLDILLGAVPRPRAAAPLYCALSELFSKVDG